MIATSFAESNHVIDKPQDLDRDQCDALSVYAGESADGLPVMISCWKVTREELEQIQRTGRVWLWVFGRGMPAVALSGEHPFVQPEATSQ
jgi:hypothetical protein